MSPHQNEHVTFGVVPEENPPLSDNLLVMLSVVLGVRSCFKKNDSNGRLAQTLQLNEQMEPTIKHFFMTVILLDLKLYMCLSLNASKSPRICVSGEVTSCWWWGPNLPCVQWVDGDATNFPFILFYFAFLEKSS